MPARQPFSWQRSERLEILTRLRKRAERQGVPARIVEQHGDPAGTILLHADARKADLVVLGSNRRRGWQRFREGSVGERVLAAGGVGRADRAVGRPVIFAIKFPGTTPLPKVSLREGAAGT